MSPDRSRAVRSAVAARRYRLLAALVALAAGVVVFVVATELFPYHSSNHDEGVYLQQAAMLLEGKLWLTPGSEPLREAVHPWFFVESERGLYPKYAPVPAAVFALGKLAGGYRLALAGVAAANVALVYALAAAAFDRPTGVLAAATAAAAPLFVISSSVFLPYAPTTMLNLLFALAYVRALRRRDARYAALAGLAVGLAFFARPYTAVLFAAPFVVHACWRLARAVPDDPATVGRLAITAGVGLAGVGVTLGYNAVVTGSPLVFPYEAFAPRDGLGFGYRRILGHELVYTPAVALRATAAVLARFATDWFTAGALGTAAATLGAAAALVDCRRAGVDRAAPLSDRQLRALLLGVVASVVAGNVYFWGTYNVLGGFDAGRGLVDLFGPFYHFDLLLPLSAFAAHGALAGGRWLRDRARERVSARAILVGGLCLLAVTVPVVGAAQAAALGPAVEANAAYTAKFDRAYEPFRTTDLDGALVFVPPEYGEWRNHPFQWLRNEPGLDGPTVYAMSRGAASDFAVLDAYPDRTYYRYRYHGAWTPDPHDRVVPVLERVRLREARTLTARTEVAVPERVTGVAVALSADGTTRRYRYRDDGDPPDALAVAWRLGPDGAVVDAPGVTPRTDADATPVPVDGPETVVLAVTLTEPSGATLTYREAVAVRPTADGRVQALWPPETSVCTLVTACGLEGTYVPDRPETRPSGIATNTTLVAGTGAASADG